MVAFSYKSAQGRANSFSSCSRFLRILFPHKMPPWVDCVWMSQHGTTACLGEYQVMAKQLT